MTTSYTPEVRRTMNGTPYLTEPGVVMIAKPQFMPMAIHPFVNSFDDTFDAADYENDFYGQKHSHGGAAGADNDHDEYDPLKQEDGTLLMKFAGQLCYLSFGDGRTRNDDVSIKRYFDNIRSSGHGSVLEHANYSFLIYGIDRAASHEAVRHRAGFAYSQLSQRYVSGKTLRFVERPEYQDDGLLHTWFMEAIDQAAQQYEGRATRLKAVLKTDGMTKTEERKAINQAARNCLPNETETAVVMTGNVRAWRHFTEMRASEHADRPIRTLAMRIYQIMFETVPHLFDDYERGTAGLDSVKTTWRKV